MSASGNSPPSPGGADERPTWPMPPFGAGLLALTVAAAFAWNVHHYAFVGDDAYISFRYARNLVEGLGLVWNPGEFVEGYTNFLWVLILAAGMWLGLEPEISSCALGVMAGAAVLLLLGRFSARQRGWRDALVWLPLLALALSRSFTAWSTGGLATQFFGLLVLAAQIRFICERERNDEVGSASACGSGSALLFALATLTRPEAVLFAGVAGLFLLHSSIRRHQGAAALLRWGSVYAGFVGAHVLWRFWYYGAWLPNTFHAKVNGLWVEQGFRYFQIFNDDYRIWLFLPLVILAVLRRRTLTNLLFFTSALLYCAYLVAIGGGRFEFRFLVVVLPALYWLIAEGIAVLADEASLQRASPVVRYGVVAGLCLALLVATHLGSTRPEAKRDRHHVESIESTRFYAQHRARQGRTLARYIDEGVLPADLMFSAGGAGALPYFTGWPTLDFRGLNDPKIAHSRLSEHGVIAHEHHATPEYMRERGVVIYDSMNQLLFHDDPMQYAGRSTIRAGIEWPLRAVRLGDHTMVFTTMVPEAEFRRVFQDLEILY